MSDQDLGIQRGFLGKGTIGFPETVNEKAARLVAGGIFLVAMAGMVFSWEWVLPLLFVGFALRVIAGADLSPLAFFAAKIIAPRLGSPRLVPGAPKRFAQSIGALLTLAGTISVFLLQAGGDLFLGTLAFFALLEATCAFCLGCKLFYLLVRLGLVKEQTCSACLGSPGA